MPKENPSRPAPEADADATALAAAQAENAALKARIAELESAKTRIDADETLIVKKMAKGLRREQASAVIKRQREFDARKENKNK
jgi:hypothetical protein